MTIKIALLVILILYCVITLPKAIKNLKENFNAATVIEPVSRVIVIISCVILLIVGLLN